MAAPFDPCTEWLGIESSDLVSPHLVLGLAANETDMLAIVRAADKRLTRLREIDPGSLAPVRDALIARVEQSRDTMLAGVAAVHSFGRGIAAVSPPLAAAAPPAAVAAVPPPPVPPPVPPGVPGATTVVPSVASFAPAPSPWSTPPAPVSLAAPPPPSQAFGGPPEPAAPAIAEAEAFEDVGVRVRRAPTYKKSSGTGGSLMVLALLVAVAGGLAAYVMKKPALMKKLFGSGKAVAVGSQAEAAKDNRPADRGAEDEPKGRSEAVARPAEPPAGKHDDAPPVRPNPPTPDQNTSSPASPLPDGLDSLPGRKPVRRMDKPDDSNDANRGVDSDPKMRPNKPGTPDDSAKSGSADDSMPAKTAGPKPDAQGPDEPKPEAPKPDAAQPDQPPPPPAVDAEQLDAALRAVYTSLRHHEFDGAAADVKKAAKIAASDPDAMDRVQLWDRFVTYARDFNGHLDKALDAKKDGGDFPFKDRVIAVVEVGPKVFKYRDEGETIRVPRGEIPDDIAIAIVAQWFAADGRAANHIFLGTRELARRKPDVKAARAAWQRAADGGEAEGRALQALLDDPVIRAAAK